MVEEEVVAAFFAIFLLPRSLAVLGNHVGTFGRGFLDPWAHFVA